MRVFHLDSYGLEEKKVRYIDMSVYLYVSLFLSLCVCVSLIHTQTNPSLTSYPLILPSQVQAFFPNKPTKSDTLTHLTGRSTSPGPASMQNSASGSVESNTNNYPYSPGASIHSGDTNEAPPPSGVTNRVEELEYVLCKCSAWACLCVSLYACVLSLSYLLTLTPHYTSACCPLLQPLLLTLQVPAEEVT